MNPLDFEADALPIEPPRPPVAVTDLGEFVPAVTIRGRGRGAEVVSLDTHVWGATSSDSH